MNANVRRSWVAATALAVAVAAVDTVGWMGWLQTARMLAVNPDAGSQRLADDAVVSLPSFAHRARRLSVRDLTGAQRQTVVDGLTRLGTVQISWMPTDPAGPTHVSHAALLGDRPTEALSRLDRALTLDPMSPSLRRLRALVRLYLGALDTALDDLAVAHAVAPDLRSPRLELTPSDVRWVHRRGLELRGTLYPRRQVQISLELARSYRADGEPERAMAVLAEHGGHPEVRLQRAKWALEEGDPMRALELLDALLVDAGSPRQLKARGWSLAAIARDNLGDPEGALAAADTAIALDRTSPAPYVTLAGLAARRGDDTEALAHLRRAWGMAPADIGLLHRIAAVARRAGRLSDARLALERAVELEPEEPRHVVALTDVLLETGEYSQAAVALSRGLDRFPANPALLQRAERLRREVDGL